LRSSIGTVLAAESTQKLRGIPVATTYSYVPLLDLAPGIMVARKAPPTEVTVMRTGKLKLLAIPLILVAVSGCGILEPNVVEEDKFISTGPLSDLALENWRDRGQTWTPRYVDLGPGLGKSLSGWDCSS
jgi:hypothetical protein